MLEVQTAKLGQGLYAILLGHVACQGHWLCNQPVQAAREMSQMN